MAGARSTLAMCSFGHSFLERVAVPMEPALELVAVVVAVTLAAALAVELELIVELAVELAGAVSLAVELAAATCRWPWSWSWLSRWPRPWCGRSAAHACSIARVCSRARGARPKEATEEGLPNKSIVGKAYQTTKGLLLPTVEEASHRREEERGRVWWQPRTWPWASDQKKPRRKAPHTQ